MRALGFALFALLSPIGARAAPGEPPAPPVPAVPEPDDEPEPPLIPNAEDRLGGHLVFGASAGLVVPWGDLDEGAAAGNLGSALGLGLDAGYGLSRSVVIGLWGQFASHRESAGCGGCLATGYAVGPFVRYHLVQGIRFDPWLLAGLGYRALKVESGGAELDYSGIEWLRVAVGGDYYPTSALGFGPMLELTTGVFGSRPDTSEGAGLHFGFQAGVRIVLDLPGR